MQVSEMTWLHHLSVQLGGRHEAMLGTMSGSGLVCPFRWPKVSLRLSKFHQINLRQADPSHLFSDPG
ncbi:hypothetical protein Nmel_010526 [Mimus melanotis]